jgi:hypothetical protein
MLEEIEQTAREERERARSLQLAPHAPSSEPGTADARRLYSYD